MNNNATTHIKHLAYPIGVKRTWVQRGIYYDYEKTETGFNKIGRNLTLSPYRPKQKKQVIKVADPPKTKQVFEIRPSNKEGYAYARTDSRTLRLRKISSL